MGKRSARPFVGIGVLAGCFAPQSLARQGLTGAEAALLITSGVARLVADLRCPANPRLARQGRKANPYVAMSESDRAT